MDNITGGQILVKTLEKLNVEIIFGIPGVHNLDVYDALLDSRIRHVTSRHEQGAGFMADGYARITGKPGIALVITGPGLTNILTPMGQAYHDSVPMVVISSQVPLTYLPQRSGYLHELKNSTIMAKSVAKESRTVMEINHLEKYLVESYELAISGRPGPVHLEIPLDILSEKVNFYQENKSESFLNKKYKPLLDNHILEEAVKEINEAEMPVLIIGGGAWKAKKDILKLAEYINAPIFQTTAGKGLIDETHPLCFGTRLHFPSVKKLLSRADLVIAIGTEMSPTDLWENPLNLCEKIIQIDIDPGNFNQNYKANIGIKGDVSEVLPLILQRILKRYKNYTFIKNLKYKILEQTEQEISEITGISKNLKFISEILTAIRKVISDEGVLVTDMTTPAYIALSQYICHKPKTFLHPVGFGTLGYALPAAIGVKLAKPEKEVCLLTGDGGFQFTMAELAVACQERISLPVIIWNNNGFGEIRRYQEIRHSGRTIAVDHENPDFISLAKAYGIKGFTIKNGREMETALSLGLKESKPVIIEVKDQEGGN